MRDFLFWNKLLALELTERWNCDFTVTVVENNSVFESAIRTFAFLLARVNEKGSKGDSKICSLSLLFPFDFTFKSIISNIMIEIIILLFLNSALAVECIRWSRYRYCAGSCPKLCKYKDNFQVCSFLHFLWILYIIQQLCL